MCKRVTTLYTLGQYTFQDKVQSILLRYRHYVFRARVFCWWQGYRQSVCRFSKSYIAPPSAIGFDMVNVCGAHRTALHASPRIALLDLISDTRPFLGVDCRVQCTTLTLNDGAGFAKIRSISPAASTAAAATSSLPVLCGCLSIRVLPDVIVSHTRCRNACCKQKATITVNCEWAIFGKLAKCANVGAGFAVSRYRASNRNPREQSSS